MRLVPGREGSVRPRPHEPGTSTADARHAGATHVRISGGAVAVGALALIALASTEAAADQPRKTPAAIDVDRDATPPGRVELGFDGGAPVEGYGASVAARLVERPIEIVDGDGNVSQPVRRRESLVLGGAMSLLASAVVDVRLPLVHQVGDRSRAFGETRRLDRFTVGDLRFGVRLRVGGKRESGAFLRGELTLPTGNDDHYAGEASWAFAWSLIGRAALPGGVILAAAGGIRLRGAEVLVADRLVGNELHGAVGVVVPLRDPRISATVELGAIAGDSVAGATGPSPVHAGAGLVVRPTRWLAAGVRAGAGLVDQIGSPRAYAMLELAYVGTLAGP
ncbi:MAG: hypothetical protein KF773_41965 [Deltaproteobacteria bacterium]|nr:hypothetical protein [Deltaproteobacteria bacterium]